MLRTTWISFGHRAVAELGPAGFRLLPDCPWEPLHLENPDHLERIRNRLGDAFREARESGSASSSATEREHTPENWAAALRAKGVPAEAREDHALVPGVGQVRIPDHTSTLKKAARNFTRAQTRLVLPALLGRVAALVATSDPRVEIRASSNAVLVRVDGAQVALVNRFSVTTKGAPSSVGDILADPRKLQSVKQAVARALEQHTVRTEALPSTGGAEERSMAEKPSASSHRPPAPPIEPVLLFELPDRLPVGAVERALQASSRLRAERTLAPVVAVEIATALGTLVFEPVDEQENPLEARFTFRRGAAIFSGALRLKRPGDPLALRVGSPSHGDLVGEAWAAALIVYAELTCVPAVDEESPGPTLDLPPPRRQPPSGPPGPAAERRAPHARRRRPALPEVDHDLRLMAYAINQVRAVSGHVRRLPDGRKARPQALRAAERLGIRVPHGYTWVNPYGRGKHPVVRVRWPRHDPLW
ncbi:MAG: hypothetical protein WKF96_05835 [Solirubrobacteraceae bacterium]